MWAVAWLTNNLVVDRPIEEVEKEVAVLNAFARRRYLKMGVKHPDVTLEWFSLVKVMFKELGIPLPNKSKSEPWYPKDYRGSAERWRVGRGLDQTGEKK